MPRPLVLMNAAVSIDGKLAPASRLRVRLGSDRDRARMDRLRAASDAILIGAGTLRAEDPPLQVRSPALRRGRVAEGRSADLLEVVLTRSLDLPLQGRFLLRSRTPRLIAVAGPPARVRRARALVAAARARATKAAPPARGVVARSPALRPKLASAGGIGVIAAGDTRRGPGVLLGRLWRGGVRTLLVEGGGATFAWFFEAGAVDEIHLTVCPWLIGGRGAPTLFDGTGFARPPFPRMRLDHSRREAEEVYLRYRRGAPKP